MPLGTYAGSEQIEHTASYSLNIYPTMPSRVTLDLGAIRNGARPEIDCGSVTPSRQSTHQKRSSFAKQSRHGLMMQIRTQTWPSDSHGLYDYESCKISLHGFKCACMYEVYHVIRLGRNIKIMPCLSAISCYESNPSAELLMEIRWQNGAYYVCPPSMQKDKDSSSLWLAVRRFRDQAVAITTGDHLKLGRFRLKVQEVVISDKDTSSDHQFFCSDTDCEDDCETAVPPPESATYENLRRAVQAPLYTEQSSYVFHVPGIEDVENQAHPCPNDSFTEKVSLEIQSDSKPSTNEEDTSMCNVFKASARACRICLCEVNEDYPVLLNRLDISDPYHSRMNPLISPCACKGSMKWIHLQCLRRWMAGRLNIRSDSNTYYWQPLKCELCKTLYPTYIDMSTSMPKQRDYRHEDIDDHAHETITSSPEVDPYQVEDFSSTFSKNSTRLIKLFRLPRPKLPYAILAIVDSQAKSDQGYHIVGFADNSMAQIGRGHDSQIRIPDISVSRLHATVKFQPYSVVKRLQNSFSLITSSGYGLSQRSQLKDGCFFIEDNRSKFGTLLELKNPFRLELNFPAVSFQVNRTVVTLFIRRRWRFSFPACLRHNHADIYDVTRQIDVTTFTPLNFIGNATSRSRANHLADEDVETTTHRATSINEQHCTPE